MGQEDLQPALEFAAKIDYRDFIPYMQPEPDLADVLAELADLYPLAVATNRGTSVEPILEHFDLQDYFSVVVTSRDVPRPKPAPDMLLLAAKRLKLPTSNCLFIGDSDLDQQAAVGAQVRFAAYGGLASGEVNVAGHLELRDYLRQL